MSEAGAVISRERLIDEVWDTNWFGSTKTLDVHVSSLRRKLGDDSPEPALHPHRPRRGLPLRRRRRAMSLRARLVVAFTYVLVLVIVALEVPLALNLSKSVDAEVKNEARSQAQLVAAGASGTWTTPPAPATRGALRPEPRRPRDRGRQPRQRAGRFRGPASGATDYGSRPEIRSALQGRPTPGRAPQRPARRGPPLHGRPGGGRRPDGRRGAGDPERRRRAQTSSGMTCSRSSAWAPWRCCSAWWWPGSSPARSRSRCAAWRDGGRVAHGDLDARASVEGSAEQQEVATAFNDMTARVASTLRGQREFVANASHQLRTPLTGLRLRLEAAALKSRDPEVERELTAAEHETERLARLLSELLTLAGGGERPAAQPLDVAEVIDAACGRWEGPAERSDHELRVEPGEAAVVAASAEDLAAILDNLTENALNYSPPGTHGHAHLGERRRDGPARRARRGPRPRARRGRARLPALLPRLGQPRRRRRHGARPRRRGGARRALGRRGHARQPARGRRPRRGRPRRGAGFANS